jgi:hypothetical protein
MSVTISGDTGIDKVQDGSIVNADLATGIDAAKLTGTLPAIDGASLTNLPAPAALTTASGSAPSYSARAWVNFNGIGTVTIKASGNVSSITDNGTGDYTVNFATAMSDVNYAASAFTCAYTTNFGGALAAYYPTGTSTYIPQTKTTSAARILTGYTNVGGLIDNAEMSFIVYR